MHVMLDLETLGKVPGCVILSIGAVAFDSLTVQSTFEAHIDVRSSQQAGLTIDADTVMWWLRQDDAARQTLLRAEVISLNIALLQFADWLRSRTTRIWSKGPSFDAAILGAAYRAVKFDVPWDFRNERCVRTVLDLTGIDTSSYRNAGETRHHALTDALVQTRAVQAALQRIGR